MPIANYRNAPLQLIWVQVDDEIRHVSDFAELPRHERPQAFCPACGGPVVLKLGKRRRHHAAHHPGTRCALQERETLLHFNCKHHIARQLRNARQVWVQAPCADCGEPIPKLLAKNWSDVRVEYRVREGLIPDVSLWWGEETIAGIEVYVSHWVDENKATRLKEIGFTWVEIQGSHGFYQGDTAWNPKRPLVAIRYSDSLVFKHISCHLPLPEVEEQESPAVPDNFSCANTENQDYDTAGVGIEGTAPPILLGGSSRTNFRPSANAHARSERFAALTHLLLRPANPTWTWDHDEIEQQDQVFSGKHCVVCGNRGIAYASNSGPLCRACSSELEIREAADARQITDELKTSRVAARRAREASESSSDNGLLSPQG